MENTAKAYEAIARATGSAQVAPDAKGWIEMSLPDNQSLFVEEVDAHTLEISARVEGDVGDQTGDQIRAILRWNTDNIPMRVALEPGKGPIVGQRVDVRDLDALGLKDVLGKVVLASHAIAEALSNSRDHISSAGLAHEDGMEMIRI